MKRKGFVALLLLVAISFATTSLKAQDYKTAVGIRFSSHDAVVNNSISFRYFFEKDLAAEALLSFSDPVAIGALVEKYKPIATQGLTWFYGGGFFVAFGGDRYFGPQGILGLDYKFTGIPLNLSLDWKPELSVAKEFSFEPAAVGISARFTFK